MGLVVLALRCYLVFQNVFITFKTLKLPPPSSRNNGRPSVRGLTQRKRDMKGCMAIWIVWCCLALYESLLERIVWIFIPFYDELKSVTLIFLILSRARSAEPIYLHVIRPLLKPYVSTLDAVLGFVHNVGDFILLVLSLPFSAAISWWYGSPADEAEDLAGLTEVDSESVRSYGDEQPAASKNRSDYRNHRNTGAGAASREQSQSGAIIGNGHITNPRGVSRETRSSSDTLYSRFYASPGAPGAPSQRHEIWHPPPSSHEDIDEDRDDSPADVAGMPEPRVPAIAVDDWPTYPPFPSAYPPTPVHPSQINMPEPVHPSQFSIIQEEGTGGAVPSNDQTDGARQGFGRSLLPPRFKSTKLVMLHQAIAMKIWMIMKLKKTHSTLLSRPPSIDVFSELCLWAVKFPTSRLLRKLLSHLQHRAR
ncbi:hypothetical protein BC826DRAFT_206168 [Russula brevipes]|nr:hypothetical protein BC826DRAFT_206168 [Russula brevipes]